MICYMRSEAKCSHLVMATWTFHDTTVLLSGAVVVRMPTRSADW